MTHMDEIKSFNLKLMTHTPTWYIPKIICADSPLCATPLGLIIIIVLSELKESKDVADELKSQTNVLNNKISEIKSNRENLSLSLEEISSLEPEKFDSLKKLGDVRGELNKTGVYTFDFIVRFLGEIEDVLLKDISKLLTFKSQGIFFCLQT